MFVQTDFTILSGWLAKRGPTVKHKWVLRWCKLTRTSMEVHDDETCQEKRACIILETGSRAQSICDDKAPGEAVKHMALKPFAFVLDVDPTAGKKRRLFYFDAGTEETLKSWIDAIQDAVIRSTVLAFVSRTTPKLQPYDVVIVNEKFLSDSGEDPIELAVGDFGTIRTIDDDGDAHVYFDRYRRTQWVFKKNLKYLKKERADVRKQVALEIIPQGITGMVIMHWAIRVGSGNLSRCYEFEANGIIVGKDSALDKGFPMETHVLDWTNVSHQDIQNWTIEFGQNNLYCGTGDGTFGGKNCQDFSTELCEFLGGENKGMLPMKQADKARVGLVGAAVVAVDAGAGAGVVAGIAGAALAPEILVAGAAGAAIGVGVVAYNHCFQADEDDKLEDEIQVDPQRGMHHFL